MNYKLIYDTLVQRGKQRRTKVLGWGAWHKHHIIPKHMGGDNTAKNLTKLQVKEHRLAHKLLHKIYGKYEDYIAYSALGGSFENSWDIPEYREFMLPKVINNLSKVDRVYAGQMAAIATRGTLHKTLLNPEVRKQAQDACRQWIKDNPKAAADRAKFMHTDSAVLNMSASKSKYIVIDPQGNEYQSTKEASIATGHKVKSITNWIIRSHYGWSRKLKVQ